MSRLVLFTYTALLVLAACRPAPDPGPEAPLNILLIVGDDHAAYVLGAAGDSLAQTPNLDRLAEEGVRFDRAYVNSPFCTASRQSFLTGLMPHTIGVTQLRTALPDEATTLAERLAEHGYATAAFGKMHFNSALRHGFDEMAYRQEYREWLFTLAPLDPPSIPTQGVWRPFAVPAREWLNADYLPGSSESGRETGWAVTLETMDGAYYVDRAADFMTRHREKPFFLVVGFGEPHSPFHFPVEFAGLYDPAQFEVREPWPADTASAPLVFRDLAPEERQGITAAYYTSVAYLDRNIGRLLAEVDRLGLADNTLVIYAGDNGYSLGRHDRFEKHTFYEESVRVPLIVRAPCGRARGAVRSELVDLLDLAPTVLRAAGVAVPDTLQGQSLWPLLGTGRVEWRDVVVSVYHENEEAMIRTGEWKLVYGSGRRVRQDGYETTNPTPGRTIRLFDVRHDPAERDDLSADPVHRALIDSLLARLLERIEATTPVADRLPPGLDAADALDRYLVPPEERSTE